MQYVSSHRLWAVLLPCSLVSMPAWAEVATHTKASAATSKHSVASHKDASLKSGSVAVKQGASVPVKPQPIWLPVSSGLVWLHNPKAMGLRLSAADLPALNLDIDDPAMTVALTDAHIKQVHADVKGHRLTAEASIDAVNLTASPSSFKGKKKLAVKKTDPSVLSGQAAQAARTQKDQDDPKQIQFSHVHYTLDLNRVFAPGLLLGAGTLKVDSAALFAMHQNKLDAEPMAKLSGLAVASQITQSDSKIKFDADWHMDALNVKAFSMKNFDAHVQVLGLNADAMNRLYRLYPHKGHYAMKLSPGVFEHIAASGLTFNLKQLHFDSSEGSLDAHAKVVLPAQASGKFNPMYAMMTAQVQAHARVGHALLLKCFTQFEARHASVKHGTQSHPSRAEKTAEAAKAKQEAEQSIQRAIQSGWLMDDGSTYTVQVSYQYGVFKVNGKAIRPSAHAAALPQVPEAALPKAPAASASTLPSS
jgi:hypothetical protein